MMLRRTTLVALMTCCSAAVQAREMGLSLHSDLWGGGIEVTKPLSERINWRAGYHQATYAGTDFIETFSQLANFWSNLFGFSTPSNAYNHHGKQQMLSLVADWYPSPDGQMRYSFGVGYNHDVDNFVGQELILGGYNLGNAHYSAAQIGSLTGTKKYNSLAPYFGMGWGNPLTKKDGWGFTIDAGWFYTGKPSVTLNATGTPLATDLETERIRLENDAFQWLPQISLGFSYAW